MSQPTYKSLVLAMQRKDVDMFRSILHDSGLPKDASWLDYELLVKAIQLSHKRIANLLLDYGARVFKRNGVSSPLHLAVTKLGWMNVVERLLEGGAKVRHQDAQGNTPLHVAFGSDVQGHVLDMLLKRHLEESSRNVANDEWLDFLHIACTRKDVEVVEKLVRANPSVIDFRVRTHINPSPLYAGYTPIRFAVEHRRYEVVEFLLKNGASIWASEDAERSTPLHYAFEKCDTKMVDIILAHTKERYDYDNNAGITHFMLACTGSDPLVVEDHLAQADAKPWTSSSDLICRSASGVGDFAGYTPLHFAVELGHADSVQTLLDHRADCCTANSAGLTAHQLARRHREQHVWDMLAVHCKIRAGHNRRRPRNPTIDERAKEVARDIHFTTMLMLCKTNVFKKFFAFTRSLRFRGFCKIRFAKKI